MPSGTLRQRPGAALPIAPRRRCPPASRCRRTAAPPRRSPAAGRRCRPRERGAQLGTDPVDHVGEQAPLAAGLSHPAGDLGAEHDPPLGGGLGAAALLLVAGGDRQQHHVVTLDEHLPRHHDVLVDPQRHPAQRRLHRTAGPAARRGSCRPTSTARRCRRDRRPRPSPGAVSPGRSGTGNPHVVGEGGGVLGVDRQAARQGGGVGAHLGAALHARVPADGHEPHPVATDGSLGQRQVDDRRARVSAAPRCWVMPIDHTWIAPPARASSSTNDSSVGRRRRRGASRSSASWPDSAVAASSKPSVWASTNACVDRAPLDQRAAARRWPGPRRRPAAPARGGRTSSCRTAPTRRSTAPSSARGPARGTG